MTDTTPYTAERHAGLGRRNWSVVCDFDGTVAIEDFVDRLLERHADPAWRTVEDQWKSGRIGSRECLARQIDMVRCSTDQFARLATEMTIDPGFAPFVALCRQNMLPLRIVSDGLDVAIRAILAAHDLDGLAVHANRLDHRAGRRMGIQFPEARENCIAASGMCKCAQAETAAREAIAPTGGPVNTLVIGDGASDFCVARRADFVFAKGSLARFCTDHAIAFAPFHDFFDVCRLLTALLEGGIVPAGAVSSEPASHG